MQSKRLSLCRSTQIEAANTVFPARLLQREDSHPLAELMLLAYRGTVDDEGEDEQGARQEVQRLFDGAYGPFLWDASFVVQEREQLIGACLCTQEAPQLPLLAFSLTHPSYQKRGLATQLISSSLRALHHRGFAQVRLVVTAENRPAVSLYEKLGFRPVSTV